MRNEHEHTNTHLNAAKDTRIPVQTCEKRIGGGKYNRIVPQKNINIAQQELADKIIWNIY